MKNTDSPVPIGKDETSEQKLQNVHNDKKKEKNDKKKKKFNSWPLKALAISFVLSFAVNTASELVLTGAQLWLAIVLTLVILAVGAIFDIVGTASTSSDIQPFLAMASRKVKGAKTAVKLSKNSNIVSSVCCDIIGDVCGVVSGVCAATIASSVVSSASFIVNVLIYALIATATITLKAAGKSYAVKNANDITFFFAKILSIFVKEG
ncbi:MAG: hypothetical protein IKC52_03820 [Clostridia bacterium]|nr:hypothetical protein [Clostridia bacterium]